MNILIKRQKETAAFALPFIGATLITLLGMFLFPQQTWAQERKLELVIDKAGILIFDGQLPETPIHFNEGDNIIVHLKNNTASKHNVRWHGVYRVKAQGSDSAPEAPRRFYSVQRAIEAGETFTYRWKVEEPGTFWYHCHLDGSEHYGKLERSTALARR